MSESHKQRRKKTEAEKKLAVKREENERKRQEDMQKWLSEDVVVKRALLSRVAKSLVERPYKEVVDVLDFMEKPGNIPTVEEYLEAKKKREEEESGAQEEPEAPKILIPE